MTIRRKVCFTISTFPTISKHHRGFRLWPCSIHSACVVMPKKWSRKVHSEGIFRKTLCQKSAFQSQSNTALTQILMTLQRHLCKIGKASNCFSPESPHTIGREYGNSIMICRYKVSSIMGSSNRFKLAVRNYIKTLKQFLGIFIKIKPRN